MKVPFFVLCTIFLAPLNVMAALCVEDNVLKCDRLGYNKSSCPEDGIACPFDTTKWHCPQWTCQDGFLYSEKLNNDCVSTDYHGLECYDCSEEGCFAYNENDLQEYVGNKNCPKVIIQNDITLTKALPAMAKGQTLKSSSWKHYTLNINPTRDISTSDYTLSYNDKDTTISKLLGVSPRTILVTAEGATVEDINFTLNAEKNVNTVIVANGDTVFKNIDIIVDGKNSSKDMFTAILGVSDSQTFEGSNLIEINNIKVSKRIGINGIYTYASNITSDNLEITQKGNDVYYMYGLYMRNPGEIQINNNLKINQSQNSGNFIYGFYTYSPESSTTNNLIVTQTDNEIINRIYGIHSGTHQNIQLTQEEITSKSSYAYIYGLYYIESADSATVEQHNNTSYAIFALRGPEISAGSIIDELKTIQNGINFTYEVYGVRYGVHQNLMIEQNNLNYSGTSSNGGTIYGLDIANISNKTDIKQTNNNVKTIHGFKGNTTSTTKNLAVTQTDNKFSYRIYGISEGNHNNITLTQQNLTLQNAGSNINAGYIYGLYHPEYAETATVNQNVIETNYLFGLRGIQNSSGSVINNLKITQSDVDFLQNIYGVRYASHQDLTVVQTNLNHLNNNVSSGNVYGIEETDVTNNASITQTENNLSSLYGFNSLSSSTVTNNLTVSQQNNNFIYRIFGIYNGKHNDVKLIQKELKHNGSYTASVYSLYTLDVENKATIDYYQADGVNPNNQCIMYATGSKKTTVNNMSLYRQCATLQCGTKNNAIVSSWSRNEYAACN